ncbi:SHOCT domain-containing protein [Nitrosopumilus sp.]|uniref:SHOCT domain-containing protein n=1 Tax=Nitrosopumilus sp. TaxID=2024843 RepID=UPI00261F3E32|nr:SHOCT domain-containing protein [Nitrosopumilus sp.]
MRILGSIKYLSGIITLMIAITISPIFAEVTDINVSPDSVYKGDQIKFSGNVEKNSKGLVTIVIRDHDDEFIQLTQASINHDYSFDKIIKIDDNFSEHGVYNATAFILNMTKGITTSFNVSLNGIPIILEDAKKNIDVEEESPVEEENKNTIDDTPLIDASVEESKIADFVDPNKDPQHYIDRYYTEALYKSWFDRNYPGLTIEEAVGKENKINSTVQEFVDKKIIPEAEASSIVHDSQQISNNSEIAEVSLAIAGLGILFGAVIGIKKKVDGNSKQISINKNTIKKIIQPIIGLNPKDILQTRLVKGEITLDEYDQIISKLD